MTRRRTALVGTLTAVLLALTGQNALAGEAANSYEPRRTVLCVHVDHLDYEVCLKEPIRRLPR